MTRRGNGRRKCDYGGIFAMVHTWGDCQAFRTGGGRGGKGWGLGFEYMYSPVMEHRAVDWAAFTECWMLSNESYTIYFGTRYASWWIRFVGGPAVASAPNHVPQLL